jgi:predicted nucleic acid-binding protein
VATSRFAIIWLLLVLKKQPFGEIKAQLRKEGMLLEDVDLLIAATARVQGLTLVTNNQDHFGRISGLHLDNWVEPQGTSA